MGSLLFIFVYLFPTVVAFWRDHPNYYSILVANLFLGWTVIGWFIVLVWALTGNRESN